MPAEGLDWLPNERVLTDDEVLRLIGIGVERLGIREVRFTGGEPLVRRGLVDIVARTRALDPGLELSVTTNGLGLARLAGPLAEAGLDRVNVSLDTIRPETFHAITRRDRLHDVLEGLEAAAAAGLGPVKVNAVLLRDVNDDQAPELLEWAVAHDYQLRFIEQMPLDAQHGWSREAMVTAEEILERLEKEFTLTPAAEPRGSAPAELFRVRMDMDEQLAGMIGGEQRVAVRRRLAEPGADRDHQICVPDPFEQLRIGPVAEIAGIDRAVVGD